MISSHEIANNSVMDTREKTEKEIRELSDEFIEIVEILEDLGLLDQDKDKLPK